jgi:hypothetical protein
MASYCKAANSTPFQHLAKPRGVEAAGDKTLKEAISRLLGFSRICGGLPRYTPLDDASSYCVLGAAAFMELFEKTDGFQKQAAFTRLLRAGLRTESDLRSWLTCSFSRVNISRFDASRKRVEAYLAEGIKVFLPGDRFTGSVPAKDVAPCPGVLFAKGTPPREVPLLAVFNSRKPRKLTLEATWLEALRRFPGAMKQSGIALIGSTGTLSYDLASAFAKRSGMLKLLVAPFPLMTGQHNLDEVLGESPASVPVLSCMLGGLPCPGKRPLRCRDRLLALLSDFHLLLEIRSRGNLALLLEEIQSQSPRPQLVLKSGRRGFSNGGNHALLEKFPEFTIPFRCSPSQKQVSPPPVLPAKPGEPCSPTPVWKDYLFHYTRACNGPWPGQTYRHYLLSLLDAPGTTERSALDSLRRIAEEGLLRAGCGMVRGKIEVVCLSSLPPEKLCLIRKWRPPLARWTVEPYGVAVKRTVLRALGAKPAVYGSEQTYRRLDPSERFRFQSSGADNSWRREHEWRLQGDLVLDTLDPGDTFLFVQTTREKAELCSRIRTRLPIVALEALR